MDIDTLEGDELDDAVALALGGKLDGDGWRFAEPLTIYGGVVSFIKTKHSFSECWEYGGPIIDRERISLLPPGYGGSLVWEAGIGARNTYDGWEAEFAAEGPTALIAAMRCFVAASHAKIT